MDEKKTQTIVIALDEPNTLRDRLGCSEWATTESIKIMSEIGIKDIALLAGLAHSSLKHIDLQDSMIVELPEALFENCESLETIKLPQCSTLPNGLLKDCKCLKSIYISNQATAIEDNVFEGCESLEEIEIPENISKIGEYSFKNCKNLNTIFCKSQYPPVCNSKTFEGINEKYKINVIGTNINNYRTTDIWKHLKLIEVNQKIE